VVSASLVLTKAVVGGPTDGLGDLAFDFTVTCGAVEHAVRLGVGETSAPFGSFAVGTTCEIVEGSLPAAPAGFEWAVIGPLAVTLSASGENAATFTNTLVAAEVMSDEVAPTTTVVVAAETLPTTGAGSGELVVVAGFVTLAGLVLLVLARREPLVR